MAAKDSKIRMTIVLDNSDYFAFHKKVEAMYANHTKIVRYLIREWISGNCDCQKRREKA